MVTGNEMNDDDDDGNSNDNENPAPNSQGKYLGFYNSIHSTVITIVCVAYARLLSNVWVDTNVLKL